MRIFELFSHDLDHVIAGECVSAAPADVCRCKTVDSDTAGGNAVATLQWFRGVISKWVDMGGGFIFTEL